MAERPKISIVTRAYNVEIYIRQCAESVLQQSVSDFEWIVLENGSTDGTRKILEEYAKADTRIRLLINEENYNKIEQSDEGFWSYQDLLRAARGDYIADLDSDDILHCDFLKLLYAAARRDDADIVAVGSVQFQNDDMQDVVRIVCPKYFCNENIREMGNCISDFYDAFRPVWGKLIRRELYLENMDYIFARPSCISYGGDTYTCMRLLQLAKRCTCIDVPLYYYRFRPNSTSSEFDVGRIQCMDVIFEEIYRLLKQWNQMSDLNILYASLVHAAMFEDNMRLIADAVKMRLREKLEFMEALFQDALYQEYISLWPVEIKKQWDEKCHKIMDQLYNSYKESEGIQEEDADTLEELWEFQRREF